jgi:hypothetical protein
MTTTARFGMVVVAAAAAVAACQDGTPVARGFGSRQLLEVRDPSLRFSEPFRLSRYVPYETGSEGERRYWAVDVELGEVKEYDALYSDLILPPSPTTGRFTCAWAAGDAGDTQLHITDTETGAKVTITNVRVLSNAPSPGCPTEADLTLMIWRYVDNRLTLWTGPFDALAPAPLDQDLVVSYVVTMGSTAAHVIAGTAAAPEALGLHRIDLASFAVTTVVPAALAGGGAWAPGLTPAGDLESSTLAVLAFSNGGGLTFPTPLADHFLYARTMNDGSIVAFVGPFTEGPARELALARHGASTVVTRLGVSYPSRTPMLVWSEWASGAETSTLRVFDNAQARVVSCDLLPASVTTLSGNVSNDGTEMLLAPDPYYAAVGPSRNLGPVIVVTPARAAADGTGACTTLAASNALTAGRSRDGTALFWLVQRPDSMFDTDLWTAAHDGSAPRLLGTDAIAGPPDGPRFISGTQLQIRLGDDLAWLDLHDDPVQMHYIAEKVFGGTIDIGRWLVTGYGHSSQDANGRLGVISRQTGETLLISPEVERYSSPDLAPYASSSPDRVVHVVYLVRGRNPSPQDGLWLATVDGAALQ